MDKNFFKKIVYSGVGFVSLTAERMKQTVEGLISDGKISEDEGKKIMEDFNRNTETKRDELEGQFKSIVEKVLKSFSFATESDFEKMENRVAVLEALLAKDEGKEEKTEQKTLPKKTSTKKTSTTRKTGTTKKTDVKKDDKSE